MKFSDIPGHEPLKDTLRKLADSRHVPHALMISGPAGVGKHMIARAFAQYVHCENPSAGEPCGICSACRLHADMNHPDVHFIYPIVKNEAKKIHISTDRFSEWKQMLTEYPTLPEEKWQELIEAEKSQPMIYVNEADEIVRADSYAPITADKKIFLIWQPEKMNEDAANKILKVLEEPADSTLFILVSDNEMNIIPTIFSRVQKLHAGRLDDTEIERYLISKYHFPEAEAMRYSHLCEGSLTKADEFGTNTGESEEFFTIYQDLMRSAYAKRPAKLRQLADSISSFGREKIRRFLSYIARMLRENFIYNMKMPQLNALTPEEENFSVKFSPFVNHTNIEDFLAETDRARRDIERNGNARLILFDYFLLIIILLHRKAKK